MVKRPIKEYRHAVAILKKAGLIAPTIDARSVTPNRKLSRAIARYQPLLTGEAQAISPARLKKLNAQQIRQSEATIARPRGLPPRAIVSKRPNEKVVIDQQGRITRRQPNGVTRVSVAVPYKNLEQYLERLGDLSSEMDKEKGRNGWFSFRFFGNNSRKSFRKWSAMVDYFSRYESVIQAIDEEDSEDMMDVYAGLEIVQIPDTNLPAFQSERRETRAERRKQNNAKKQQRFRDSMDDSKQAKYKAAAKKRAAKSRKRKI